MLPIEERMAVRGGRERRAQPERVRALLLEVTLGAREDLVQVRLETLWEILPFAREEGRERGAHERHVHGWLEALHGLVGLGDLAKHAPKMVSVRGVSEMNGGYEPANKLTFWKNANVSSPPKCSIR